MRSHALMTEAVHAHGALAGVELWHGGGSVMNRSTRLPPLSPSGTSWMATHVNFMGNQRPKRHGRRGHPRAARQPGGGGAPRRAARASTSCTSMPAWATCRTSSCCRSGTAAPTPTAAACATACASCASCSRSTHEAVGGKCAVALRISLEELRARPSEAAAFRGTRGGGAAHGPAGPVGREARLLAHRLRARRALPPRAATSGIIEFVKQLTDRPVVGVGRFTSPDTMVSQIRRGVLDLIGAARPSIADPFLPRKIDEGREQDIRECIGCNICISSWHDGVPVRCTQNPTIGEEWRRGWHPERIAPAGSDASVLVVGAGPAGLECALSLGRRGYEVTARGSRRRDRRAAALRDAAAGTGHLGTGARLAARPARAPREREHLPRQPLERRGHPRARHHARRARHRCALDAAVVFAAGDARRRARRHRTSSPPTTSPPAHALEGPVVVYDFDNYYMGSVLAEHLARERTLGELRDAGRPCLRVEHHEQRAAAGSPCAVRRRDRAAHARARGGPRARRAAPRAASSPACRWCCRAGRSSSSARASPTTRCSARSRRAPTSSTAAGIALGHRDR